VAGEIFWVAVLLVLSVGGWVVTTNYRDAAYRLFDFYSKNTVVGAATPGVLRFVGAVMGTLAAAGSVVEIISLL
jgi:hypothetical protein